eukprot:9300990-Prorocentrum_lima.AAC.1
MAHRAERHPEHVNPTGGTSQREVRCTERELLITIDLIPSFGPLRGLLESRSPGWCPTPIPPYQP